MDWDGTTSLVRAGWAEIMAEIYLEEALPQSPEERATLHRYAWDEMMLLNGRPSIHQMVRLAEMVAARGGKARDAQAYQVEFQLRLGGQREARLAPLRVPQPVTDALLVPGVRAFFERLRAMGIPMTLASGTAVSQVIEEAELLQVAHFFEGRIYGPGDTGDTQFTKRDVIHRLLRDSGIAGGELIAFGDGPVELVETAAVGGYAVAVASDEVNPGQLDVWKQKMLLEVGAHAVIADYTALEGFFGDLAAGIPTALGNP